MRQLYLLEVSIINQYEKNRWFPKQVFLKGEKSPTKEQCLEILKAQNEKCKALVSVDDDEILQMIEIINQNQEFPDLEEDLIRDSVPTKEIAGVWGCIELRKLDFWEF